MTENISGSFGRFSSLHISALKESIPKEFSEKEVIENAFTTHTRPHAGEYKVKNEIPEQVKKIDQEAHS